MAVTSLWQLSEWEMFLRLAGSALLGGMVGIEREWSNHAAGFRTHILVCLGSTTIMLLSIYGFSAYVNEPNVRIDPARLAAQVISGIGFLGAGAIMRNGSSISGLTTAASIWIVAAIGLCVGAGFWGVALMSTLFVLVSLVILNKWEKHLMRHRRKHEISFTIKDAPGVLGIIASIFGEHHVQIANVKMNNEDSADPNAPKNERLLTFYVKRQNEERVVAAIEHIIQLDCIVGMDSTCVPSSVKKKSWSGKNDGLPG